MIGKLIGIVDEILDDQFILNVNGVGYIVFANQLTLRNLPLPGNAISFYIETIIREDAFNLYGFNNKEEQTLFRSLITVKGVGPKLALQIMGQDSHDKIASAIKAQDKNFFKSVSGVGPKLAERIIVELKNKSDLTEVALSNHIVATNDNLTEDAISALVNLGYSKNDAYNAVSKSKAGNDNIPLGKLITAALKELAR